MKRTILWGAMGGLLLLSGAANASFDLLNDFTNTTTYDYTQSFTDPDALPTGDLEGLNTLYQQSVTQDPAHEIVQFSTFANGGGIPNHADAVSGFIDPLFKVDPTTTLDPVDQVTLFGNDAGSKVTIEGFEYFHTDLYLQNTTGTNLTFTLFWDIANGLDPITTGVENPALLMTTSSGVTPAYDPLAALVDQQLNATANAGSQLVELAAGDFLNLSFLSDVLAFDPLTGYAAQLNQASANFWFLEAPRPVPAPGTLLLLAAGLAGLGMSRRKQKA